MAIRLAKSEDTLEIQRLFKSERNNEEFGGADYDERDWKAYLETPHSILLVSESDDKVVGFLVGYDLKTWGYVDVLVIDHAFRGKGLGTDLLKRFEGHGLERWGCVKLCIDLRDLELKEYLLKRDFKSSGKTEWFVRYPKGA